MKLNFYLICLLLCAVFSAETAFCQSYGLGFAGQDVVQDKRTGLDLCVEKPLCFKENFQLSFDLSFTPGHSDYFGYIFRIIDNDKRNFDLLYDKTNNEHFKLIMGDRPLITFDINIDSLYKHWYNIQITFNKDEQKIQLQANGKSYEQSVVLDDNCYKILFGASDYREFRVTDVPPMKIRDLKMRKKEKLLYHWLLNEGNGNTAKEELKRKDAAVVNPLWLKKQHYDWQAAQSFTVAGAASFAFNPKEEVLYIVSQDSLFTYDIALHKLNALKYQGLPLNLLRGNQSLFDTLNMRLLNLYLDEKLVSKFDFESQTWGRYYKGPDTVTNYWHHNKFYVPEEDALYILGGYGHFHYHHKINRYHFQNKTWESYDIGGDYVPRYLAALGMGSKGVYLLGGYGSSTGQQILNPKNIYDLSFYDIRQNQIKKIYDFKPQAEDFAFANSMVIHEDQRSFYALAFPNHRYNSYLQLIKGSLDSAVYEIVGSEIPYIFHDIASYADLYYSPLSDTYVAVTSLYDADEGLSTIRIFTLLSPPKTAAELNQQVSDRNSWFYPVSGLLVLVVFFAWYGMRKRRWTSNSEVNVAPAKEIAPALVLEPVSNRQNQELKQMDKKAASSHRNSILLFGDLQLYDAKGNDITKSFTPLIKELFLAILLYTLQWERGISTEKLTELLWFDKSADSARNNRSVNIAKLKSILEKLEGGEISKETGYWKFNFDEKHLYIDYFQYLKIIKRKAKLEKEDIALLGKITQRGGFLANVEYNWLDMFKSEISNEIIDSYLQFADTIAPSEDPEILINIANNIFYFDTVNEDAMMIKCRALVALGKHSLAKTSFEHFSKEYAAIYATEFPKTFQQILQ